jgi:hypothetical protein
MLPKLTHITNPTQTHTHTLKNKLKQPQQQVKTTTEPVKITTDCAP